MNRFVLLLLRFRWLVCAAVVAGAVALSLPAAHLQVRNDMETWFVQGDPALQTYLQFRETFGTDEVFVVAIEGKGSPTTAGRLQRLDAMTTKIAAIDGIERVSSLTNALSSTDDGSGTKLSRVVEGKVETDDVARATAALTSGGLAARFVAPDGTTAIVMGWLRQGPNLDARRGAILTSTRHIIDDALAGTAEQSHIAGAGVVYDALNALTETDGAAFIGAAYLIVLIAVLLATRRILWTVVALVAVSLADMALFGIIALSGHALNAVTITLPTLVMVLGVANVIHIASHLDAHPRTRTPSLEDIARDLADVVKPIAFNALTTSSGFIALIFATMSVTKEFGAFSAIGVLLSLVTTVALVVAWAPYSMQRGRARPAHDPDIGLGRIMSAAIRRPRAVLIGALAVTAVLAAGTTRLIVDTYTLGFLPDSHLVVRDAHRVQELVGPFIPLEISLQAGEPEGWKQAGFLRALGRAEAKVRTLDEVGAPLSVLDVLRDVRAGLRGEKTDVAWTPTTDEDAGGILGFLDVMGLTGDIGPLIGTDRRSARLTVPIGLGTARELTAKAREVEGAVRDVVGSDAAVSVTGYLPLYGRIVQSLVDDQIASFFIAFFLVFGIIGAFLRSWRLMVCAIVPNVLPVALVLGVMGWTGIRLDVATMTIAATILGIVVDDTVHVLYRIKLRLAAGDTIDDALAEAVHTAGSANLASNCVLMLGFAVLAFATVRTVGYVGLLSCIAVFGALIADVVLVPPLAWFLYRERPGTPRNPIVAGARS